MASSNAIGWIIASLICLAIIAFAWSTARNCFGRLSEWRNKPRGNSTTTTTTTTNQTQLPSPRAMIGDAHGFELQPVRGARPALYRAYDVEMPFHQMV